MISVIIPAYKATKYIDECLSSIKGDCEILIGVDGCEKTYSHIKHLNNVFYFEKNIGPYVIKNTLVDVAKGDVIVFFDSDDVMVDGLLPKIDKSIQNAEYIPLNYINFQNKIGLGHMMNDAVIAIKKETFNSLNGFYPWRCGADTEFAYRLKYNNITKGSIGTEASYYRRLHGENLTMTKETGHGSPIRTEYVNIINRNIRANHWPNPNIKTISEYVKN